MLPAHVRAQIESGRGVTQPVIHPSKSCKPTMINRHRIDIRHLPELLKFKSMFVWCGHAQDWRKGTVVCRHWVRGWCMKADNCDYLHRFDLQKMPPCRHKEACQVWGKFVFDDHMPNKYWIPAPPCTELALDYSQARVAV